MYFSCHDLFIHETFRMGMMVKKKACPDGRVV